MRGASDDIPCKALLLRRGDRGSMARYSDALVSALPEFGVSGEVEDAIAWMPLATARDANPDTAERLRERATGYDVVHAFGYRCAWACAEAFRGRLRSRSWCASLLDFPATLHPDLFARLGRARACFCASRALVHTFDLSPLRTARLLVPGTPERGARTESARLAAQADLGVPPHSLVVLALGRLRPDRDFVELVRAMERLSVRVPEAALVIAGAGSEQDRLAEEREASREPERVLLLPWQADTRTLWDAADVVVVPGREPGFSMAAIEAMAAGHPVVAYDEGAMPEIVDDRVTGVLMGPDAELADRLAEVLRSQPWREQMGLSGRLAATERFSISRSAGDIAAAYRRWNR